MPKKYQIGITSKFSGVKFRISEDSFDKDRESLNARQFQKISDKPFHLFWEPGLIFQVGKKNVQAHMGYSFSTDLTDHNLHRANGNFSIGLCFRINTSDVGR
jgi:hypothetical protein